MDNIVYKHRTFYVQECGSTYSIAVLTKPHEAMLAMAHVVGASTRITRQNMAVFKWLDANVNSITTTDGRVIELRGHARDTLLKEAQYEKAA